MSNNYTGENVYQVFKMLKFNILFFWHKDCSLQLKTDKNSPLFTQHFNFYSENVNLIERL